jgi:hypothetical protein
MTLYHFESNTVSRALPILRQLGTQGGSAMIRGGDFSMLKVWGGLEIRSWLQASIEDVSSNFTQVSSSLPGIKLTEFSGGTMRQI